MFIADHIVQTIKDAAQVDDIIGRFIPLKKQGANLTACCPFHDEKSPSFSVSPARGIYKCFGCGAGGDAISFVMRHQNQSFNEALHTIAAFLNIEIEYQQQEITDAQKLKLSAADEQENVLSYVIPAYQSLLTALPPEHAARQWLTQRHITDDIIAQFNIGWAGEDWHFITPTLINKNYFEAAHKLGIIKRSDHDNNYDGYRSRITFPISDRNGRTIGLGGRYIATQQTEKEPAKYINPPSCELYDKSATLYGLSQASPSIRQTGFAYITEGYMDVISPSMAGITNTVATCGTAFTQQQMALLKKITTRVCLWRDNDKAGKDSTEACLPLLLKNGFAVELAQYKGKDPDEYIQSFLNNASEVKEPERADAITSLARQKWTAAADDVHKRSETKKWILDLLSFIPNDILRNNYLDIICKEFKWKTGETKKEFDNLINTSVPFIPLDEDADTAIKFPPWLTDDQRENYLERGYLALNRKEKGKIAMGYYAFTQNGKTEITNFQVTPLFHIYAGSVSRFLIQIDNGILKASLDIPAAKITSIEQFMAMTVSEGNFVIFGTKNQWLRIASDLLSQLNNKRCNELNDLGWISAGFFAFSDYIFTPASGQVAVDNYGIFKFGKEQYLLPQQCEVYRELQKTAGDPYENDRCLIYKQSPISFTDWSKKMHRVFGIKAAIGIAWLIFCLFRDIVMKTTNTSPHLYLYGPTGSGKSAMATQLYSLFFTGRKPFIAYEGTIFAFYAYLGRFVNAPAFINEFDVATTAPDRLQTVKGVFDGEGRERGKKEGGKRSTEIQNINCGLMLVGQYLITADDNAIVNRSIIEDFIPETRTEEDMMQYSELDEINKQGISSLICELLMMRKEFEDEFRNEYLALLGTWLKLSAEKGKPLQQRIMQNYCMMATSYAILSRHYTLPVTAQYHTEYCLLQARKWSAFVSSSDTLSDFWRFVSYLFDCGIIVNGWDVKVETVFSIETRSGEIKTWDAGQNVLFLRLNNIHKVYQKEYRTRNGKDAMTQENLLHYFNSKKYFIGPIKQKQFTRYKTIPKSGNDGKPFQEFSIEKTTASCHAFLYDEIAAQVDGFNLVNEDGTEQAELIPIRNEASGWQPIQKSLYE